MLLQRKYPFPGTLGRQYSNPIPFPIIPKISMNKKCPFGPALRFDTPFEVKSGTILLKLEFYEGGEGAQETESKCFLLLDE